MACALKVGAGASAAFTFVAFLGNLPHKSSNVHKRNSGL